MHVHIKGPLTPDHARIQAELRLFLQHAPQLQVTTIHATGQTVQVLTVPDRWAVFVTQEVLPALCANPQAVTRVFPRIQGWAPRPEWVHVAQIRPTQATTPFPNLTIWTSVGLALTWTATAVGGQIWCAAADQERLRALADQGWQIRALPASVRRIAGVVPRWTRSAWMPLPIPFPPPPDGDAGDHDPAPPAPALTADAAGAPVVPPSVPEEPDIARRLLAHLEPLITVDPDADAAVLSWWTDAADAPTGAPVDDGPEPVVGAADVDDGAIDGVPWPPGPGRMRPADVAYVLTEAQTSPICGGSTPGLTRKRLATLLPDHLREYSRVLMTWFDQADVLEPPPVATEPLRNPRLLRSDLDAATLAERLTATPLPDVVATT